VLALLLLALSAWRERLLLLLAFFGACTSCLLRFLFSNEGRGSLLSCLFGRLYGRSLGFLLLFHIFSDRRRYRGPGEWLLTAHDRPLQRVLDLLIERILLGLGLER
jgi:hypothetical protein